MPRVRKQVGSYVTDTTLKRKSGTDTANLAWMRPEKIIIPDDPYNPYTDPQNPMFMNLLSGPLSDLEALLLKRLHLENYKFNFFISSRLTKVVSKKRVYNPRTHRIELIPFITGKHYHLQYTKREIKHIEILKVRFSEFLKVCDFPKDFQAQFPYLYYVLRDLFFQNNANRLNVMRIKKSYDTLHKVLAQMITLFYALYTQICAIPAVVDHFKAHPEELGMIKQFETLLDAMIKGEKKEKKG